MNKKRVILIQPPLLHPDMDVDAIQNRYWQELNTRLAVRLWDTNREVLEAVVGMSSGQAFTSYKQNFSGFVEPNIGLLYVAAAMKRNGYPIEYIDFHLKDREIRSEEDRSICLDDVEGMLREVDTEDALMVGISPLTVNYGWAARIARALKEKNDRVVVVLGGVHATFDYANILSTEDAVDIIVVGEGEKTIVELCSRLSTNGHATDGLEEIKGLAYRKNGEVFYTGAREMTKELDALAYPAYEILPEEYQKGFMVRVLSSRGCSNRCSFCVPSNFFRKIRYRDPKRVVDEMEHYHKENGSKLFMIGDLNFMSHHDHASALCSELIKRDLGVHWICQSRVEHMNPDMAALMRKAGCFMVCLGIESADQDILDGSNKGITPPRALEACRTIREAGMLLFTFWVFGLPGETHESAHRTILLLRTLLDRDLIDYSHCTVCVPYPGTRLFDEPGDFNVNILTRNFDEYWMGCDFLGAGLPVIETEALSSPEIYAYWQLALAAVAGNLNRMEKPDSKA